jgi:Tfp pilus assembly protein PilF
VAGGLEAVFARGAAALQADDLPGAEQIFRSIVEAEPRAHPAWNGLSVVAVRRGEPQLALAHAQRALELDRRNPVYLNSLGVAHGELGQFAESEQAFRRALKARPVYPEGLFNLGKVLHKLGRLDDALRAYERVRAMQPDFPGLVGALVAMYRKHGRADRALALLAEARSSVGADDLATLWPACLAEVEGPGQAVAWLRQELARDDDRPLLHYHLAELLLGQEQWRDAWREYFWRSNQLEERRDAAGKVRIPPPLPERLEGQRILLRSEQGMGDVLFFLRFAPALAQRGARLSLAANERLAPILGSSLLSEVRAKHERGAPGEYDREILVGDLPWLLGAADTPPAWPLEARADTREAMHARLAALGPPPYLGVTWRAGTDTLRQREFGNPRSVLMKEVPADALGVALRGWPGTLVSLQRGPRERDLDAFSRAAQMPAHDLGGATDDLGELLALLSLLDEYVAVSNTNIHILAGLGRAARVLVPYPPEWRWTSGEGGSPWFPGFAVYREPQSRGWDTPLAALRRDLIG